MNPLLEQEYLSKIKECKENAKKYYDRGDYAKASEEYLRCSKHCEILVEKTEDETKKREYYDAFEKFVDASVKLKKMKPVGVSEAKEEREGGEQKAGFTQYIRDNVMRKEKENLPSWDDIGGLENVKDLIKKSVVIGIIENKPKAIEAWNTILFYGPPGTGKTLMAAAVAKNIDATFFDVKVSQMLSKYYGESPKIMSALFEVAREEAPSVVFIDEFDSIALSRGADIDEESRRGLSTLLAELDGLGSKTSEKKFVLVIAATNTPDAIDEAVMSRFGKKIEIPLPDYEACKVILRIHTEKKGVGLEDEELYDKLAMDCVEHKKSGRDIKFICTEAIWSMLDEMNPDLEKLAEEPYEKIREYELKTRELKDGDFDLNKFKFK
ncbi:MAG: ATP-binding protein [Halobacteriota archaeon]